MRKLAIAPSILAADFARLGEEIRAAEMGGANRIHIDVMDGHFVPNITMGPVVVRSLRPITALPFDVHLMISDPDRYLEAFAEAGSNLLIPHIEAARDIRKTVGAIHKLGLEAGVAISPDTPISALREVAADVELILVMSVYPGFAGQAFLEGSIARVREGRALLDEVNPQASVGIDGGIDSANVGAAVKAGADNLVAAKAIFQAGLPVNEAIAQLRAAALAAQEV